MKPKLSVLVFGLCCLLATCCALIFLAYLPRAIMHDSEGWSSMLFRVLFGPVLAGAALLLGVLPSALLYRKGRSRTDLISLRISGSTLGALVIVWLTIEPLRRWIIFGINPLIE